MRRVKGRLSIALGGALLVTGCSSANFDAITARSSPDAAADGDAGAACPTLALAAGDSNQMVQVGSMTRSYLLHVPSSYTGGVRVPLILDFHGIKVSGAVQRMLSTYPAQTDPEGVVMAFPNGATGPYGAAWNVGPCCVAGVDDVAFTRKIVEQVQSVACIDPDRVYAVGFSMGGGMAYQLGCQAADLIAAIAPSSFDLLQENVNDCHPSRPLSVISFRGTSDTLVSYTGGLSTLVQGMPVTFLGAQATFQKWGQLDGCTGDPSSPDSNGCSTYSPCSAGVQVTLCSKQGGGQEQGDAAIAWPLLLQHPR